MKKYFILLIVLLSCFNMQAQEAGKFRVSGNLGLDFPNSGFGGSIDLLDVRYNILDNWNAGLKLGGAMMMRDLAQINSDFAEVTMHVNSNLMLVSDYYFNNGSRMFAPFVGGSFGLFNIYDLYMLVELNTETHYQLDNLPDASKTLGAALRAGFELGRFRLAMEYYMIPETRMYDVENIMVPMGHSANNYFTVNIGFYLGGGRWRKW